MDEKSSSPANARSSMIGSAFAVVKNYFTPERASIAKTNQSVGITPLARSFATLTLDDSSHDSTGSFRTTFSQQDDSFQSTASHVDLLDEYNETSEDVADQTVVVEETLLDSSVSSLDINCTVNDGIDDSIILVSDSNDSPQIVFANVAKKEVIVKKVLHDISANLSNEYHKNIEDILEDVNDDGSLLSDILQKYDSPDIATDNDIRNENNQTEESSIGVIDNQEESQIKADGTSLTNISTVSKESASNISTPVALKSESVNNFSPIFIPEIVVTQVYNNDVSPVFDDCNSFDTEHCDNSPNDINNTQIIIDCQENSGSVEHHKGNGINVVSTIQDGSCNNKYIIANSSTMNETANSQGNAFKEELVEDPITEQSNRMPVDNMSKEELPSELAETSKIEKCTEITLNEISQVTDVVPLDITSDPANNKGKLNDTNDSLNTTKPLTASVNIDVSLNITNGLNNIHLAPLTSDKVKSSNELALSELANAEDTNLSSNPAKDAKAFMVQENDDASLLNITEDSTAPSGIPENTENIDTLLSGANKIEFSAETVKNIANLSSEAAYNNDGLLNYTDVEKSTNALSNVSNEAVITTVSLESVNDENADSAVNVTNDRFNATVSFVTSESSDTLLNATNELLITNEHLVSSENPDAVLNENESLNTTVPLAISESSDALLNVTNEPLSTTELLVTSEHADVLLNEKEPLNTTVPLAATENPEAVLNENEPLNSTQPFVSANADATLLVTSEPLNTTAPLVTSENANTVLNVSNEPLNATGPLVTSAIPDAVLNENDSLNTTVPLAISESSDPLLNVTNGPLSNTAALVTSEHADVLLKGPVLNVTREPLNTTAHLVTSENANAVLNVSNEPLNATGPLVTSAIPDAVLDENEPLDTAVPLASSEASEVTLLNENEPFITTVPLVTSENADAVLNVTNAPLNTTVPLPSSELSGETLLNENEPINTTVPLVTSDNVEAALNVKNEAFNTSVPLSSSELSEVTLLIENVPLITIVPLVTSENADDVLNVTNAPLNTTVPLPSSEASEIALLNEIEPFNTTVSLVTSENVDAVLNIKNEAFDATVPLSFSELSEEIEPLNTTVPLPSSDASEIEPLSTTVPLVTSENADAVLNVTNAQLNTTVPLPSSEASEDALSNEIEPFNTTVSLVTSENVDAVLNIKNETFDATVPLSSSELFEEIEPLNTTVPLPSSDASEIEPLNTTVPSVTSENADALLNVTNEPLNTTVPLPSSEASEIEPFNTTVPLVTSENADALLNVSNEPLNSNVPLPSSEASEIALLNEIEPFNTTVPSVTSENADALLNVTNEPLNTTVPLPSSETVDVLLSATNKTMNVTYESSNSTIPSDADIIELDVSAMTGISHVFVNVEPGNSTVLINDTAESADAFLVNGTNMFLNDTVPLLANTEISESCKVVFSRTDEALNSTVPLVVISETTEKRECATSETADSAGNKAGVVALSDIEEVVNISEIALNNIDSVHAADSIASDISEPLNRPLPALESKDAVSCGTVSNVLSESVTSDLTDIDHAINIASEVTNTALPITIETKSALNTTASAGTTDSGDLAEAILNTTNDGSDGANSSVKFNITNQPGNKSDNLDSTELILNNTYEPLESDSETYDFTEITDSVLNVTNKQLNTTVPLLFTSENREVYTDTTELILNTYEPIKSSYPEITDAVLNVTNVPLLTTSENKEVHTDTTELILNTTYEPIKSSDPETSDLTEITDVVLNVTNEPLNTTVPLLATSENREVLEVSLHKSIHEIVDVTPEEAGGANAALNVTYDPIKTTVSPISRPSGYESHVPLDSSLPTDILEHIGSTDTGLNVTSVPLVAMLETAAVAETSIETYINPIASDAPSESTDQGKAILNITDEPINIPTAASDNADSPLVTLNITSGSTNSVSVTSNLTGIVDPLLIVTNEPLKIPASENGGQSINPLVSVTLDGADSSNNALNNSIELSKRITKSSIACHVDEPNASISLGGTDNVENILNISSFSINVTVPQVSSESEKNIDDILNISNLQFVEAVVDNTFVGNRFENDKDDIQVDQLEDTDVPPETKTDGAPKPLHYIKETLVTPNVIVGEPFLESTVVQSEDVNIDKKNVSIDFDQCLEDFENGVALGETFNAVALPSLELDECEIINDCKTSPEVQYFNTEALGEFLKENKRHILTPISESRENSMLVDSPAFNKRKIKFGEKLLNDSISNRLFSSTFDVSPINVASPLVSQSITPITNSLTNSPIQQEKQFQSTPETVFAAANSSDPNKTFTNAPDTSSKPFCADFNLNSTHIINVDGTGKSLNETHVLIKPSLNETVTLSPFNSLDVTRTINMAEEFTRECEKNRTLLESTIVLDKIGEVDPNATVLLTRSSEINLENSEDYVINKTVKSQNSNILNNLQFERKPLSSVENNKIKLQNISEILFESNTQENMNGILSGNNKNKNMPVCVLKERSENIPENTMGAWFSSLDKNAIKPPTKTEILDNFENPVFSNAADLDIFNTDFQPSSEITGRDSLYLKFDPLYSTPINNDQTIFVTPLLKSEAAIDTPDVNNENSLEKLKAEVARLHVLLNQQENIATEKLNYLQIRNEEVNIRCRIEQEKLDKLERNEKILENELKNRESTSQQMNALAVSYNEIISNVEKDLQKLKEEHVDASAVKSELESSKHHLKSAEDAFMDVLAKYEKISATVPDLRANNEQKKKKISELQRESLRIDERVRYCESTLAAEMEEIRRTSKLNNDQFGIETSRLTAQLRKTELTHKNTKDTFDNIIVENEKLANLCDDIIAGKS